MTDKAIEAAARAMAAADKNWNDLAWENIPPRAQMIFLELAQAAVQAYLAAKEAEGSVMAPVEATNGMLGEGWGAALLADSGLASIEAIYRAMIAARPQIGGE